MIVTHVLVKVRRHAVGSQLLAEPLRVGVGNLTEQQLGAHGFNSGWFWFKYPPLHAFVLSAVYAPYLAWLWASGGLHGFQPDYPFGMADPLASLSMLAMLGKATSAVMGAGCALLAYACTERSLGRASAVGAALLTALAYPMVFYAQTTNVEVPYLFWMMLALLAAVRLVEGAEGLAWWALLGAGAALERARELFAPTMVEQVVMSLDDHDRLIAYVLGLSHALNIAFFTALAGSGEAAPRLARLSSTTFDAQLDVATRVAQENPDLYFDIQRLNDFGAAPLAALASAVETLRSAVAADDRAAFRNLMERGRAYLEDRRSLHATRA